jgi:hypothetical protein
MECRKKMKSEMLMEAYEVAEETKKLMRGV